MKKTNFWLSTVLQQHFRLSHLVCCPDHSHHPSCKHISYCQMCWRLLILWPANCLFITLLSWNTINTISGHTHLFSFKCLSVLLSHQALRLNTQIEKPCLNEAIASLQLNAGCPLLLVYKKYCFVYCPTSSHVCFTHFKLNEKKCCLVSSFLFHLTIKYILKVEYIYSNWTDNLFKLITECIHGSL